MQNSDKYQKNRIQKSSENIKSKGSLTRTTVKHQDMVRFGRPLGPLLVDLISIVYYVCFAGILVLSVGLHARFLQMCRFLHLYCSDPTHNPLSTLLSPTSPLPPSSHPPHGRDASLQSTSSAKNSHHFHPKNKQQQSNHQFHNMPKFSTVAHSSEKNKNTNFQKDKG